MIETGMLESLLSTPHEGDHEIALPALAHQYAQVCTRFHPKHDYLDTRHPPFSLAQSIATLISLRLAATVAVRSVPDC